MPGKGTKSRHWVFTINNPTDNDIPIFDDTIDYLVWGRERGDDTGTPHLQGYICFGIRKYLSGVKKHLPRARLHIMNGTSRQAIMYAKKEGRFVERGCVPKTAAEATKDLWDDIYAKAKRGDLEMIPKNILVRHYHGLKRIRQDNPDKPDTLKKRSNVWITAPSGYGKSTYAREMYPDFYDKPPNKWYTGYKGENTVLLDDFGPMQFKFLGWYTKRWSDVFPYPVETKGGGMVIRPEHIVVTSQYTIGQCFDDPLVCEAVENRFEVLELDHWRDRQRMDDTTRSIESIDSDGDSSEGAPSLELFVHPN